MHRVIRRSLIVAAALWPCFVGPSQAAPSSQTNSNAQASSARPLKLTHATKRKARSARKSSRHRHAERASRTTRTKAAKAEQRKIDEKRKDENRNDEATLDTPATPLAPGPSFLEPAVANARAELTSADAQSQDSSAVAAESDKAARDDTSAGGVRVAAADQLNDIDRNANALPATPSPGISMTGYAQNPAAFSQAASEGDAWDRASLIGKIFIAFGTLLTLASAARLMIA